jgi:hypothetical protein
MSQFITYLGYPLVAGTLIDADLTHQDGHDRNSRSLLDDIFPPLFPLVAIEVFKFYTSPLPIEVIGSLHHFLCFFIFCYPQLQQLVGLSASFLMRPRFECGLSSLMILPLPLHCLAFFSFRRGHRKSCTDYLAVSSLILFQPRQQYRGEP